MCRSVSRFLVLLTMVACDNPSELESVLMAETDKPSYVATAADDSRFDYSVAVAVKFRNETDGVVRIHRCTTTSNQPPYLVETAGEDAAAWDPNIPCAFSGTPYVDLAIGQEHVDTLQLRAPWQRLFNGQPVGAIEGDFRIFLEVQLCGSVTRSGSCLLFNKFTHARSNRFSVTVSD